MALIEAVPSWEDDVIAMARAQGLELVQRELENGQLVWTWRREDRCWDFLARRQAIAYMADRFR